MILLELFCGTKSISKSFKELGIETITLDNDNYHKPDICKSILDFDIKNDLKGNNIDFVWASPPCTTFSMMSFMNYWHNHQPKNSKASINLAFVLKTIELINEIKPKYWFIENPMGYLRTFNVMKKLPRKEVTYCQYGLEYMKPTDIWTNAVGWIPRKKCKNNDKCHKSAPRGSHTGIQGEMGFRKKTWGLTKELRIQRAIIPKQLCDDIANFCIGNNKVLQERLIEG